MKYRIIGNMTGNSMDAVDLVLTEFDGQNICDICSYSKPFSKEMQRNIDFILRPAVKNKTAAEILKLPFFQKIHDAYIQEVAACINEMLTLNNIDKKTIDVIGFHGKTLDHYPPSKAKRNGDSSYTLQIGSGQMLADLTGIPVVYDFRSDYIMNGFDGAPLIPPHNAHIAFMEGDGCYYNGGNTANFAWIIQGKPQINGDAGPFNEYTDNFIRRYCTDTYDKNGKYGLKGKLLPDLMQKLFNKGRSYYESPLPKSGDPAYYFKETIFTEIEKEYGRPTPNSQAFCDIVHTFEYFAAYIALQALTLTDATFPLPAQVILFGGGWKNPIAYQSLNELISGNGFVLNEHQKLFNSFLKRFEKTPRVHYSRFGKFMEARLFADLARYYLEKKAWELPNVIQKSQNLVVGTIAYPRQSSSYTDQINRAAKGWKKFDSDTIK